MPPPEHRATDSAEDDKKMVIRLNRYTDIQKRVEMSWVSQSGIKCTEGHSLKVCIDYEGYTWIYSGVKT